MDTISKVSRFFKKNLSSLAVKLSLSFIAIVLILLFLANTYFLTASRDMIFTSKQTMLKNHSAVITTSLSAMDTLNHDNVSQIMELLNVSSLNRISVISADGKVLYDSTTDFANDLPLNVDDFVQYALSGNMAFYSNFSNGAFRSALYNPIPINNGIAGVLILYDIDVTQGSILLSLQSSVKTISIVVGAISIAVIIFLVYYLLSRIKVILKGIQPVREGHYNSRIEMSGNDELSTLATEFNRLTQRLEETDNIRRRFVADASHELKTPLASIRLLSDSILQVENIDTETAREFVEDIGNEAERLAHTTERLLSLTKLDNEIQVHREPIDITYIARQTIRILQPIADARSINLETSFEENCYVMASEDELYHIVMNLIENAIKYNEDDGSVLISISSSANNIVLTVEDTGVGVPAEDLPHIFDRFYRVDKARSREAGGTGLGLSIVRSTVSMLQGSVIALRRKEGGMTFQVRLPMANL